MINKIYNYLLLLIVTVNITYSQEKYSTVTFRVEARMLPPASASIFIAGNRPELGNWHPGKIALEKQPGGTWQKSVTIPEGAHLEFKFTLGKWTQEALRDDGSVFGNHTLDVESDTTLFFRINAWKDDDFRPKRQITGTVKYHRKMKGKNIKPRDVIVWLPPGYVRNKQQHYPVLYMHDGQNIIEAATSFLGMEWQIDETADSLINAEKMREIIIVGIYNTTDRSIEYSDTPTGHAYMEFLIDTLKPFIDANYRTLPGREHTATMGSSMGGLISFLLAWYRPEIFSQAGCLSPAFIYQDYKSINLVENDNGPPKKIRIYMDNGGVGVEDTLQYGCDKMLAALQQKGFVLGENLIWFCDEQAEHNEKAWAKRVWRPLLYFFRKNVTTDIR